MTPQLTAEPPPATGSPPGRWPAAQAAGKARLAREIEGRLALYQAGQPFYEPPTEGRQQTP